MSSSQCVSSCQYPWKAYQGRPGHARMVFLTLLISVLYKTFTKFVFSFIKKPVQRDRVQFDGPFPQESRKDEATVWFFWLRSLFLVPFSAFILSDLWQESHLICVRDRVNSQWFCLEEKMMGQPANWRSLKLVHVWSGIRSV